MAQRAEEVECAEAAVEAAVSDRLEVVRSGFADLTLAGRRSALKRWSALKLQWRQRLVTTSKLLDRD